MEKSPVKMLARSLAVLAAALVAAPGSFAQTYEETAAPAYSSTQAAFSNAELDQMLAPIALYPDELLSQILMASTYPLEVVQAARWSRANPDMQGEDAVSAVVSMDWDPSVKSLVAFPDVLQQMDEDLDWTQRLGEAFLADQDGMMASVQRLRGAALQAGNLASGDEIVVSREGEGIAIDSPSPDTVYVPYYDPNAVYGSWWWPSYPPVYWAPWPGYYSGGYGFAWTIGIPVGVDFFYGDFDWHRRHVRVYDHHPFYVHDRDHDRDRNDHRWRFDPQHRRDVQFRNPVARQEFANATSPRLPPTSVRPPRTTQRTPPTTQRTPRPADRSTQRTPRPADRSTPQAVTSPIARPNVTQPLPYAAPVQPRTTPQQGFFPQQRVPQQRPQSAAPQIAHPPAGSQIQRQPQIQGQPQYQRQPQIQGQPQYQRQPQFQGQPQYVQPQPLARPNSAPTGVHAMPQRVQPAPQVHVAPQSQPMARPTAPAPARPVPAEGQGEAKGRDGGGPDAPRGGGR